MEGLIFELKTMQEWDTSHNSFLLNYNLNELTKDN